MKAKINILAFLILGSLSLSCNSQESSNTAIVSQVTPANVTTTELMNYMKGDAPFLLVDVRTAREVSDGFIEGAINIDINSSAFTEKMNQLDKSQTIFVYCKVGGRSAMAADKMRKMGFEDVRNVEGGFMDWKRNGFPVKK